MKSGYLCLLLCFGLATAVFAQEAPPRAMRGPNVATPRGSDSGAGPACDQLTNYGQVPPPGPEATVYGAGASAAALAAPAPEPAATPAAGGRAAAAGRRGGGGLGAAGMATRGTFIPDVPQLPYRFVEQIHPPSGTSAFSNVAGVGLLKNGHLIVFQRMPMFMLLEYDAQGRLLRNIDPNIMARPHGMRIDANDNIWLTDQSCHIVIKMKPSGEVLMTLGTTGKAGTWDEAKGDHLLNQPTDVAFAPNGDIFITQSHGGTDPRVLRFSETGKFITSWNMARDGAAPVIHTLVVHKGLVYVSDREVKNLRVYDLNGKHVRDIQMKNLICGFYVDKKDQLWMTTGQDGQLMRLDWNFNILGVIGKEGFGANDFGEAHYMTMTPDGKTIYISDTVNNDIKRLERVD